MSINWNKLKDYQDIIYEKMDGVAKITINRPEVRNAFRLRNNSSVPCITLHLQIEIFHHIQFQNFSTTQHTPL